MTREEIILCMPAYALGRLPAREAFEISRALIGDAGLMEELRFALDVRDTLRAGEREAPPMPAVSAPAAADSGKNALGRSADKVDRAFAVTGSAVRLAMGFL